MKTDVCPDRQLLSSHLLGQVRDEQVDWLDRHIRTCDSCQQVLEGLNPQDELTNDLRNSAPEPEGHEREISEIIERGKQIQSVIETVQADENTAVQQGESSSKLDGEIDFLQPPVLADEIGRLGGYRVLEVMGVGGMGVVFRAEDPKLKRQIALKAMKPGVAASRSAKDRFLREAQATAAIEHDNIVSIYQVGEDRGIAFIAMRYLRGQSLQEFLAQNPRPSQLQAVSIGRQIANGLAAAHEHGLIHRDIKPDNIWLEAKTDRAKILDFGLARARDDDAGLTHSGMVLGTPKYMAPEQAKAEPIDHRCDLFSLGSVLYQMISGKAPFEGGNLTSTLIAVSQADCKPIAKVCSGLDADLAKLITQLLAKDKEARPQSACEVAAALAKIEKKLASAQLEKENQQRFAETMELASVGPTTEKPRPSKRRPSKRWLLTGGAVAGIGAAIVFALGAAGVLFKVEMENGTLFVNVTNDDFATTVQGKVIQIRNTDTDALYSIELDSPQKTEQLKPGHYEFIVTNADGFRTRTNRFEIAKGENKEVEVWWEPASKTTESADDSVAVLGESSEGSEMQTPVDRAARDVAMQILSRGGSVVLSGGDHFDITNADQLPNGDISLSQVRLLTATDADLANVGTLKSLSRLDLQGSDITGSGFEYLRPSQGIESIFLNGCNNLDPAALRHLQFLPLLNLSAASTPCGDQTAQLLGHWPELTHFGAGVNTTGVGLVAAAKCKKLLTLDLASCRNLNPADLVVLAELPELNHLFLSIAMVNQELIESLARIPRLRSLAFDGNAEAFDASVLIPLHQLTNLDLSHTGSGIDDEDLPALQTLTNLRSLGLVGTSISKAGIEHLHDALTQCEILWDGGTIKPDQARTRTDAIGAP